MFNILTQPTPIEFAYGDLMCGDHSYYIRHTSRKELASKSLYRLEYVANNPWEALEVLSLTQVALDLQVVRLIKNISKYDCPYTGLSFTGLMPLAIATNHPEQWFNTKAWWYDMMADQEYNSDWIEDLKAGKVKLTPITQCVIGPGYTSGTMINDGGTSIDVVVMDVSNGDMIVACTHDWHNK